jgi:hypothetical protein
MRLLQKLLHHSVGLDIGIEARWLVACIAIKEDTLAYSRPLKLWNSQLLALTGFGSWGRLNRAREHAVQAGWLYYRPGEDRRIGVYWTTVPNGLDGDLKAPSSELEKRIPHQDSSQNGDQNGEPSIPDDELERDEVHSAPSIVVQAIPTVDQVKAYAAELGYFEDQAESVFEHYQNRNWQTERGPVVNWKALVAKCLATTASSTKKRVPLKQKSHAMDLWERLLTLLRTLGPYEDSHATIRDQMGDVAWQVVKSIGLRRIDSATDFELSKFRQSFLSSIADGVRES